MRILNQLGPVVTDMIAGAIPDAEVESVPLEAR